MKKALKNPGVQAFVASIICIILGLLIGYIVLLFINPKKTTQEELGLYMAGAKRDEVKDA